MLIVSSHGAFTHSVNWSPYRFQLWPRLAQSLDWSEMLWFDTLNLKSKRKSSPACVKCTDNHCQGLICATMSFECAVFYFQWPLGGTAVSKRWENNRLHFKYFIYMISDWLHSHSAQATRSSCEALWTNPIGPSGATGSVCVSELASLISVTRTTHLTHEGEFTGLSVTKTVIA